MKLAPLLAQYLYIHKRLDLPGLGTFFLDPSIIIEQENSRQAKSPLLEGVSFDSNPSLKDAAELIQFISTQTGKIKALAAADLDSHLGLAQQFINIGKPFLFEGIGNLSKIKSGEYIFSAGHVLNEKFVDQSAKETTTLHSSEEAATDYKSVLYAPKAKMKWAKPVTVLLIVVGIGLAIWGGYTVYKRTSATDNIAASANDTNQTGTNKVKDEVVLVPDSVVVTKKDSTVPVVAQSIPAGVAKFVLETATAKRAFPRYNRLKEFQWNVQMETKDSVSYTLYMLLPVSAADTARVLDSLTRLNGKRVYMVN